MKWLSMGLTVLGWLIGLPSLIAQIMARRQGRADQKAADDAASLKQAEQANAVETDVARDSHQQLIKGLKEFSRNG